MTPEQEWARDARLSSHCSKIPNIKLFEVFSDNEVAFQISQTLCYPLYYIFS